MYAAGSIDLFNSKRNIFLLSLFLLVFPKGGFKFYEVPITWGYLLLGIFGASALMRTKISLQKDRLRSFLLLIPFQVISALTMLHNGTENYAMTIAFWISFFFLPLVFFCLFSKDIETMDDLAFFNFFKKGVFFISVYGIFLFFCKFITGYFIEVPLITTNLSDLGALESKNINRGTIFKLVSTYNNGNIYGICLLMLLPLYSLLEKSTYRKIAIKLSLLLTLSRTAWIGLLFHEIFSEYFITRNKKIYFTKVLITLNFLIICLSFISFYFNFPWAFFWDRTLGGRNEQLDALFNTGFFSHEPFTAIWEVIYSGIVFNFGWAGFFLFLLGMGGPLLLQAHKKLTPLQRAIGCGLINYLFVAGSDGAILLLPTMAFYWFLASLLFRKNFQTENNYKTA